MTHSGQPHSVRNNGPDGRQWITSQGSHVCVLHAVAQVGYEQGGRESSLRVKCASGQESCVLTEALEAGSCRAQTALL